MYIYISHAFGGKQENVERAKAIANKLQKNDNENTYILPLTAFSFIEYGELGYDKEMELCVDLLCLCDKLIVASEISEGVQREIDFANLVHMPIEYLADE